MKSQARTSHDITNSMNKRRFNSTVVMQMFMQETIKRICVQPARIKIKTTKNTSNSMSWLTINRNCCLIAAITENYPVMSMTILGKEFRMKIHEWPIGKQNFTHFWMFLCVAPPNCCVFVDCCWNSLMWSSPIFAHLGLLNVQANMSIGTLIWHDNRCFPLEGPSINDITIQKRGRGSECHFWWCKEPKKVKQDR